MSDCTLQTLGLAAVLAALQFLVTLGLGPLGPWDLGAWSSVVERGRPPQWLLGQLGPWGFVPFTNARET